MGSIIIKKLISYSFFAFITFFTFMLALDIAKGLYLNIGGLSSVILVIGSIASIYLIVCVGCSKR